MPLPLGIIGASGVAAAGGGAAAFSDTFGANTIADWTETQTTLNWAISGGVLIATDPGGIDVSGILLYSAAEAGSATQYIKFTLSAIAAGGVGGIIIRGNLSSGYIYRLMGPFSGTVYWDRCAYDGTGGTDIKSQAMTFSAGDTLAVTIQGTGTSTVMKLWKNTTNNTPYDKDNWDSSSDAADYTLTDTGNVLATNPADSGQYVGLYCYLPGVSASVSFDNFFGGGI